MRLSGLSLTAVLLFASFTLAQHSSSSGSSGSSSSGSSGGSHSSSSGGSSYSGGSSGGGSHSSGGGSSNSGGGSSHSSGGGSHSSGGGHSAGSSSSSTGNHGSSSVHPSGGVSVSSGSSSHSKNEHGSSLVNSRNGMESSPSKVRPIHEPKSGVPQRAVVPEKRSFFTLLRHPFRKPPPKVVARPALYLPRPVCPRGKCAPVCPVGQVHSGGACSIPAVQLCVGGQTWNRSCHDQCSHGEIWNGGSCLYHTQFLDSCFAQRTAMQRQVQRVQAAEAARRNACANGPEPECSDATSTWQAEENLRRNLLARYQQCQSQSMSTYSAQYQQSPYDSTLWFDSLRFNEDF
jgi:hypothetical protein